MATAPMGTHASHSPKKVHLRLRSSRHARAYVGSSTMAILKNLRSPWTTSYGHDGDRDKPHPSPNHTSAARPARSHSVPPSPALRERVGVRAPGKRRPQGN